MANSAERAVRISGEIGYPVVLKIASPDITHKTDVGGVVVGISSDEKLRSAYDEMMRNVKAKSPNARILGVNVQKMIEKTDYEVMVGSRRDRDFGSVIVFGMGGTGAEFFRDFSIGLPPLNQTLARRLVEDTRVSRMIQGYRGKTPADMRQLEEILVSFSNLIVDFPEIEEIDVNPLVMSEGRACAVDARIVLDNGAIDTASPYSHLVITPYPTKYVIPWRMQDGAEVLLRPIAPEDEPLEQTMLTTLSEESLRGRFFQVIKNITHEMLTRYCNIDYDREMAIVGEVREGDERKIVGIGRLISEPDFKRGEFAVVVHDDYQGRGLGYKLVDMLIGIGHEKGLDKIYGIVLNENKGMIRICQELGFSTKDLSDGTTWVELLLR